MIAFWDKFKQIKDAMLGYLEFAVTSLEDILIKCRNHEKQERAKLVFKNIKDKGFNLALINAIFITLNYLEHIIDEKRSKARHT